MKGKRPPLIVLLAATLVIVPMAVYGQGEIGGPLPTPLTNQIEAQTPPVEQPLVPEGVFATQLVEALKLGQAQDEAQAESMLSAIGIEPKNGWIAGYPVTPPVIGEIEKGVAAAADAGKVGIGKSEALKAVGDLKAKLGLSITLGAPIQSAFQSAPRGKPANTVIYKFTDLDGVINYTDRYESIPKKYRNQIEMIRETIHPQPSQGPPNSMEAGNSAEPANEEAVPPANNYATNANPEVINNYYNDEGPPVVTYYPPPDPYYYLYAWVPYPFWYSGFFCSGYFILHDFHRNVYYGGHRYAISNHATNIVANRVFVVNPVSRALQNSTATNRLTSPQVFNSSKVQSSARTIVGVSQNRLASAGGTTVARMRNIAPSTSPSSPQGQIRSSQPMRVAEAGVRTFSPPSPRVFSPPVVSQGRVFSAPPAVSRGSNGGGSRGGGGGRR